MDRMPFIGGVSKPSFVLLELCWCWLAVVATDSWWNLVMTLVRILVRSGTQKDLLFSAWLLQEHQPQFPFKLNLSISSLVQNTILPFFAFIATVTATQMRSVSPSQLAIYLLCLRTQKHFFPPTELASHKWNVLSHQIKFANCFSNYSFLILLNTIREDKISAVQNILQCASLTAGWAAHCIWCLEPVECNDVVIILCCGKMCFPAEHSLLFQIMLTLFFFQLVGQNLALVVVHNHFICLE